MARRPEAGRARPHVLLVLVIAAVTLLTLDFRNVGPFASLQQGARDTLDPVRSAADTVFEPVTDAWRDVFAGGAGGGELEALREENAELRSQLIARDNAEEVLGSVLLELDIPYVGNIDRVVAKVVAGSIGNFDDYHIEIDKGSRHGIVENMPVISQGGLLGRVEEVGRSRSRIVLLVDPDFQVGARVVGIDDALLLVQGNNADNPLRVDEDVNPRLSIEPGASVVTSGLSNSLYPADIPVGFVSDVRLDEGALTQVLEIEPSADLESLRFVTVLLYRPGDLDDAGASADTDDGAGSAGDGDETAPSGGGLSAGDDPVDEEPEP